jgi:hypothetical protein
MASAGNLEAQYLTAKVLRWCAQTMHLYFIRPNGEVRTLDEAQARFAARPIGITQQDLGTIYSRCEGFLESPEIRKSTDSWSEWLDKSADGGYPAAIAQRAANLESQLLQESNSSLTYLARDVDAEAQAKELALSAAESGDPEAIFLMSDWVRTGDRTEDETATLMSAWKILACQKGYDCGPNSDWMLSACNWRHRGSRQQCALFVVRRPDEWHLCQRNDRCATWHFHGGRGAGDQLDDGILPSVGHLERPVIE